MGLNGLLRYFKKRREVEASYSVIGSQKSGTTWLRDCIHPFAPFCKPEWYFPELIEATHRWLNTYGSSLPPEERNTMLLKILRNAREAALMGSKGEKERVSLRRTSYACSSGRAPTRRRTDEILLSGTTRSRGDRSRSTRSLQFPLPLPQRI